MKSILHVYLRIFAKELILLGLLFDASEATNWQIWTIENWYLPKDHWTLQWKGLNLYSRGWVLKHSQFWGIRILRVMEKNYADFHSHILPKSSNIIVDWRLADYWMSPTNKDKFHTHTHQKNALNTGKHVFRMGKATFPLHLQVLCQFSI